MRSTLAFRTIAITALTVALMTVLAEPALAQTTSSSTGNIGTFIQQLVDLNVRELPTADRHTVPVLILLDEFARLGHASVIAHAFSYVAGYGLRLLPVLQSPAQLRAEYGPDLAEEIMANCGVEIAFAPKELKVAQDLSERLGYWTYRGRSTSRPALLSKGHPSSTESDQRRALMLPQELIQMPADRLIVLRAGIAPIRGEKLAYWREKAFCQRVLPPPVIPARVLGLPTADAPEPRAMGAESTCADDPLSLDGFDPSMKAAGFEPAPERGAGDAVVEAWVERYLDASARPLIHKADHAR